MYWRTRRDFVNAAATSPTALLLAQRGDPERARSLLEWLYLALHDPSSGLVADGVRSHRGRDGRVHPEHYSYNRGHDPGRAARPGRARRPGRAEDLIEAIARRLTLPDTGTGTGEGGGRWSGRGSGRGRTRAGAGRATVRPARPRRGDGALFTGIAARYLAGAALDPRLSPRLGAPPGDWSSTPPRRSGPAAPNARCRTGIGIPAYGNWRRSSPPSRANPPQPTWAHLSSSRPSSRPGSPSRPPPRPRPPAPRRVTDGTPSDDTKRTRIDLSSTGRWRQSCSAAAVSDQTRIDHGGVGWPGSLRPCCLSSRWPAAPPSTRASRSPNRASPPSRPRPATGRRPCRPWSVSWARRARRWPTRSRPSTPMPWGQATGASMRDGLLWPPGRRRPADPAPPGQRAQARPALRPVVCLTDPAVAVEAEEDLDRHLLRLRLPGLLKGQRVHRERRV